MTDNLIALTAILSLSTLIYLLYKNYLVDADVLPRQHWQRHVAWTAITGAAFLSFNFWIFIVAAGAIAYVAASKENRPLSLWITLLLAAPAIGRQITGLGLAKQLFTIDYPRAISLAILLPAAYAIFIAEKRSKQRHSATSYVDLSIVGFIAVQMLLRLNIDSITNTLRYAFYAFIDIGLPYYVASRAIKTHSTLKGTIYTIWYACLVTAALAIYETATTNLLYDSLQTSLNQYWGYGHALMRGDKLRAQTATGQPIALGYVLMIGICMHAFVVGQKVQISMTRALGLILTVGIVASISRGPWIGAAGALVTYAILSTKSIGSTLKFAVTTIVICLAVLNSPWADTITSHLPFIGTVENENITYRQNLLDFSIQVVTQNPFFGAYDYLYHPALQSLRQEAANGLIDVVNSYVGIALSNGLVGLAFFLGAFLFSAYAGWRTMRSIATTDTWERNIGRTLLASLVGIMITIFTTSSITVIPTFYWLIIGLTTAYCRISEERESHSLKSAYFKTNATHTPTTT